MGLPNAMRSKTAMSESKDAFRLRANTSRQLNGRLLLISCMICTAMTCGLYLLHCWQMKRCAPALLDRAEVCSTDLDFMKAAQYIRRYLKLRPGDNPARVRLAEVYAAGANTGDKRGRAIDLVHEAIGVARSEQRMTLRSTLAELLLEEQRFTAARLEAEKLLALDPDNETALRVRAMAVYGQLRTGVLAGKSDPLTLVGDTCFAALKRCPGDRAVAGVLALGLRERPEWIDWKMYCADGKQPDISWRAGKANAIMDRLVESDRTLALSWLSRHLYRSRYRIAGAESDLEAALDRSGDELEIQLTAARFYAGRAFQLSRNIKHSDFEAAFGKALQLYQGIKNTHQDIAGVFVELGELYVLKGLWDDAIAVWEEGLKRNQIPQSTLQLHLAEAYWSRADFGKYNEHMSQLRVWLEETGGKDGSPADCRLLGQLLARQGTVEDLARAERLFERLVNHSFSSTDTDRMMLAQVLTRQARFNAGQRQYLLLVADSTPNLNNLVAYIEFLLAHRKETAATKWIERLRQLEPASLRTAALIQKQRVRAGSPAEAPLIEQAAIRDYGNVLGRESQIEFCVAVGDLFNELGLFQDAERWHRKVVAMNADFCGPLALTLARSGKLHAALSVCGRSITDGGSNNRLKLLASVLTIAPAEGPKLEGLLLPVVNAVKRHPDDSDLLMALANARIANGKMAEALADYRRVVALRPDDAIARNNLAMLMLDDPELLKSGLNHIETAIELGGEQPDLLDTKGCLLLATGDGDSAVEVLEQALHGRSGDSRIGLHLWVAYRLSGQAMKADLLADTIDGEALSSQVLTVSDQKWCWQFENRTSDQRDAAKARTGNDLSRLNALHRPFAAKPDFVPGRPMNSLPEEATR